MEIHSHEQEMFYFDFSEIAYWEYGPCFSPFLAKIQKSVNKNFH